MCELRLLLCQGIVAKLLYERDEHSTQLMVDGLIQAALPTSADMPKNTLSTYHSLLGGLAHSYAHGIYELFGRSGHFSSSQ